MNEIAEHLSLKSTNVSRDMTRLEREDLLVARVEGTSNYWNKKAIDRTPGISRHLMDRFDLTADGLPAS